MTNCCVMCGTQMTGPELRDYVYTSLPGVVLCDLEHYTCPSCGEEEVSIPNMEGLQLALARWLAEQPARLTGAQVRFLRKVMGWSGRDFALLISVTPETVSRWEHDKEPIGAVAERLLRVLVTQKVHPITDYDAFERWISQLAAGSQDVPAGSAKACWQAEKGAWHRVV